MLVILDRNWNNINSNLLDFTPICLASFGVWPKFQVNQDPALSTTVAFLYLYFIYFCISFVNTSASRSLYSFNKMQSIVNFFFGKEPTPEEMVKKWRRDIGAEGRSIDRTIRGQYCIWIFPNNFWNWIKAWNKTINAQLNLKYTIIILLIFSCEINATLL